MKTRHFADLDKSENKLNLMGEIETIDFIKPINFLGHK